MKKPIGLFDFDGMKFHTAVAHCAYYNHRYGIHSKPEDFLKNIPVDTIIKSYLPKELHHTVVLADVYEDVGKNFLSSLEWHKHVTPIEEMCEVMHRLAPNFELWTVTARQKTSTPVIQHLLDTYIPNCISGIHCVWDHKGGGVFKGVSKRKFAESLEGDIVGFFDDSVEEVLAMQDLVPSYLFDMNNLHDDRSDIQNRVRSWLEIEQIFKNFK